MAENPRLICAASEVEEGGKGLRFQVRRGERLIPAFVVRYLGVVYGYLNQCSHVPAELDFDPGDFFDFSQSYLVCSVHGALYDPADGRCLGGRCAGKGLSPLQVEEIDGQIYLKDPDHV